MSKYDYIEEFGGGGRISPQDSATAFPEGTLGKGINGGLWINQKDKNGRLSWKPTFITKDKFPDMKIYVYENSIDILLFNDKLGIKYGYNFENSEVDFIYPENAYLNNLIEVEQLENLTTQFIKSFENEEYINSKKVSDPKVLKIFDAVQFIANELLYLKYAKNLRKGEQEPQIPTPQEEEKNTPFQKIDFLNPSTEENDIILKSIANYSDSVEYFTNRLASIKITINPRDSDKRYDAYIEVLFDKLNNIIKLSVPLKDIEVRSTEVETIRNQTLLQIAEIYYKTLVILVEKLVGEPISDNTNKITSKRTKDFYDTNKSKLDKIDSKISSKFIEALAFLSQYEESGEVIYTNQNKNTANDLISRIKNLKQNS